MTKKVSRRELLKGMGKAGLGTWLALRPDLKGLAAAAEAPKTGIPVTFTDVRKAAGITFKQDGTGTKEKYYLETMGTGVGWINYAQDGLLDLYFVQSAATKAYTPPHPLRSALYHNNGGGTFTDVTEKPG